MYGQLQQADRSGLVSVKFDEIELLDGAREKIDAVGTGLDLGPIKGNVYGKNTGKNFFVRAASGLGSMLAEVAGNNTSSVPADTKIYVVFTKHERTPSELHKVSGTVQ